MRRRLTGRAGTGDLFNDQPLRGGRGGWGASGRQTTFTSSRLPGGLQRRQLLQKRLDFLAPACIGNLPVGARCRLQGALRVGSRLARAAVLGQELGVEKVGIDAIGVDLQRLLQPQRLTVYARYLRRGGLDINPWRATADLEAPPMQRDVRQ